MPLVTLQELKNYVDITLTNRQEEGVQLILDGLHGELEALLRRPIEVREFVETWTVPENTNPYVDISTFAYGSTPSSTYMQNKSYIPSWSAAVPVYLDESPVVSVQSVTVTPAQSILGGTQTLEAGRDYVATEFGLFVRRLNHGDSVTVEYTAGLAGENIPYLKLAILRAAARETQNMHDDTVGLKDLETRNVAPLDIGFTEAEEKRLKRYKRQRI